MLACSNRCVHGLKNNQRDSKSMPHFSDNQHVSVFLNSYKNDIPLYFNFIQGCSEDRLLLQGKTQYLNFYL